MKERPILMKGAMIRAMLEDRKTQTRRIIKVSTREKTVSAVHYPTVEKCPYGVPGERLWVKETWCAWDTTSEDVECDEVHGDAKSLAERGIGKYHITYRADIRRYANKWRPSIFMPRWASRITLEIEAVRVERLIEISEEDAVAEGIVAPRCELCGYTFADARFQMDHRLCEAPEPPSATLAYRSLWESINGPGSWVMNPWVWVIQFRRIKP